MNTHKLSILLCALFAYAGTVSAQSFLDKVLKGVEKTNQVLDEANKLLDTGDSRSGSSRTGGFQIVSPHPEIDIQFTRCMVSGSTAIIDFVITNYGKDAQMQIGGSSYTNAYDDAGNQYTETEVSLGDREYRTWDQTLFPTDVPLKCRLQISDIASKATVFKRINLNIYSKSFNFKEPVIFKNIPVTRRSNVVSSTTTSGSETSNNTIGSLESTDENKQEVQLLDMQEPITPRKTAQTKVIYVDLKLSNEACTDFKDGICFVENYKTRLWAAYDTLGNQVFDFKYYCDPYYSQSPAFENGYCAIRDNKGSYIIDKKGNIIQPKANIRSLSNFCDGIATAAQNIPNPKNKYSTITRYVFVNVKGEIIFPNLVSTIDMDRAKPMRPFMNNLAAYYNYDVKRWGFINQKGVIIVKPIYQEVQDFNDGYAAVKTDNNKWGYINTEGVLVIKDIYMNQPSPFSNGYASITKREGGTSLINKSGEIVLDQLQNISLFHDEKAFVVFDYNHPNRAKYDPQNRHNCFVINTKFEFLGYPESTSFTSLNEEYKWPQEDGLLCNNQGEVINLTGKIIYEAEFIRLFHNDRAFCTIDDGDKYSSNGYINRKGEIVFMFKESVY